MKQLTLEIANQVLKTKDLSQFKKLIGNRNLSQSQILRLEKSILENNLLAINPILVNKNMLVIDGQTRLEVARRNGLEITYIIADDIGIDEAKQLNKVVNVWKPIDHFNTKIMNREPEFLKFQKFMDSFPELNIEKSLHTWLNVTNKLSSSKGSTAYKNSIDFIFDDNKASLIAESLKHLLNLETDIRGVNRYVIGALNNIVVNPNFDLEVFKKKTKTFKSKLMQCSGLKDQTDNFLAVYNRNNHIPINIKGYKQY